MSVKGSSIGRLCTKEGCRRPHYAKGFCRKDYWLWRYHNDPTYREARRVQALGQYHRRDPDLNAIKHRKRRLKSFHMTEESYDAMLARQENRCAVCGTTAQVGRGRLHIDHDHSCCPKDLSCGECIRGLLCSHCNVGIGMLKESPSIMLAAIAYLERTTKNV